MTKTTGVVGWLQKWKLVVGKGEHGVHHRSPYGEKYCIVNGMWNGVLDKSGFFRRLEWIVWKWRGVEPIAWKLDGKLREEALRL